MQIELEDYPPDGATGKEWATNFTGSPQGCYTLLINLTGDMEAIRSHELDMNVRCKINQMPKWNSRDAKKKGKDRGVNFDLSLFLAKFAIAEGRQDIFVDGSTMVSVKFPSLPTHSIIRCTEDFMGKEWYHFVVIKIGGNCLPAKVVGVVSNHGEHKFVVRHAPVPSRHRDYYSELKQNFISPFKLGGMDCTCFVEVTDLVQPLLRYSQTS
jgi:hypothetical protein